MQIEINNHQFRLLPEKAIFWKTRKTLLIGDLHLGKITHFRNAGIAVPSRAYHNNFQRMEHLILHNDAERIILLGDLFHNVYNAEWELFANWRRKFHSIEIIIVLGNHDILPYDLFQEINITVEDYWQEDNFIFLHHPMEHPEENYVFCGHIHPVYCLRSRMQSIKLPCFTVDNNQTILPSFGVFTGGYEMKKVKGRSIFVIAENEVIKV